MKKTIQIKQAKNRFQCLTLILAIFVAGIGLFAGFPSYAKENEQSESINVVLTAYDDTGYVNAGEDEIDGYYAEYLNEIAKYTGWTYDINIVKDEATLTSIVKAKQYDLLMSVDYTEESARLYFDYPGANIGSRHLVIATTKTHPDLDSADVNLLKGMKIGVTETERNQGLREKLISYCFSNGIPCEEDDGNDFAMGIRLVETTSDKRFELLEQGDIDAIITSDSTALANDLYVVADFGMMPIYAVVPKGDAHLLPQLQDALESIKRMGSQFEQRLYDKYFISNQQNELAFSKTEQEYLQNSYTFKVAIWDDCAPYAYINDKGEWAGISVEVFENISAMTNGQFVFEFAGYENSVQAEEAVNSGEADILAQTFTAIKAKERGDNRSRSFFSDTFYMYQSNKSQLGMDDAVIAVKRDFPEDLLVRFGVKSLLNVVWTDSVSESLQMVNDGKADFTFALQNVADYYINYFQLNKLNKISMQQSPVSFCSIYGQTMDDVAKGICNKCINHINVDSLYRQITEYILTDHKRMDIFDYIRANAGKVGFTVILFLTAAIALLIAVVITISKKTRKIYHMLYGDEVTGGDSFLKFEEQTGKLVADKHGRFYILFCDISNFKYINDVYGYEAGNHVLKFVERFMADATCKYPVARMYADHFVGIIPEMDKDKLAQKVENLLVDFDDSCRREFCDYSVFLKVGIYLWNPEEELDVRKAVNLANYASGNIGNLAKSEYLFYSMEMRDRIALQQQLETDMHRAMDAGEFVAFFQPKYDIVTNRVVGAEALVRWVHKDRGLIPPNDFVPVFEENHFIMQVDLCVFEQVCIFLADRIARGKRLYVISCNFSRLHFYEPDFVGQLMKIVEQYDVPTNYIEIEITETVATNDFDALISTAVKLKNKGFKISIDDFGSGYSCIQLLYKLPIDVLKLDRVFVCEQDVNTTEEDLNRSIVQICHAHNISIICEGVETPEQKEFIKDYGCRYVQGFLYSRPIRRMEFTELLDTEKE